MSRADPVIARIDELMETASTALVARRYFDSERAAAEALALAFGHHDYERMARIVMPLLEARRQKRDAALDSGRVFVIREALPEAARMSPGCYLLVPPRVGLDGRLLRDQANAAGVPALVLVREPTTRTGHWPMVALGPVTVRARVTPPGEDDVVMPRKPRTARKPARKGATAHGGAAVAEPPAAARGEVEGLAPGVKLLPRWFAWVSEELGDAAIEAVDMARTPDARVEELYLRVQAHPDHEKLHQRLMEACVEAARQGAKPEPKSRLRLADAEDEDTWNE